MADLPTRAARARARFGAGLRIRLSTRPPVRRALDGQPQQRGDYAKQIVESAATDEETLKGYLSAFEEAGADDVICFPASPDPDQVERLAKAVGL